MGKVVKLAEPEPEEYFPMEGEEEADMDEEEEEEEEGEMETAEEEQKKKDKGALSHDELLKRVNSTFKPKFAPLSAEEMVRISLQNLVYCDCIMYFLALLLLSYIQVGIKGSRRVCYCDIVRISCTSVMAATQTLCGT